MVARPRPGRGLVSVSARRAELLGRANMRRRDEPTAWQNTCARDGDLPATDATHGDPPLARTCSRSARKRVPTGTRQLTT
jgi:hypothetical protein